MSVRLVRPDPQFSIEVRSEFGEKRPDYAHVSVAADAALNHLKANPSLRIDVERTTETLLFRVDGWQYQCPMKANLEGHILSKAYSLTPRMDIGVECTFDIIKIDPKGSLIYGNLGYNFSVKTSPRIVSSSII